MEKVNQKAKQTIRLSGTPPTALEKKKIRSIMKQVSIRKASLLAGIDPAAYHNVMAGQSKNMTDFNKIIAMAKRMIEESERLVL